MQELLKKYLQNSPGTIASIVLTVDGSDYEIQAKNLAMGQFQVSIRTFQRPLLFGSYIYGSDQQVVTFSDISRVYFPFYQRHCKRYCIFVVSENIITALIYEFDTQKSGYFFNRKIKHYIVFKKINIESSLANYIMSLPRELYTSEYRYELLAEVILKGNLMVKDKLYLDDLYAYFKDAEAFLKRYKIFADSGYFASTPESIPTMLPSSLQLMAFMLIKRRTWQQLKQISEITKHPIVEYLCQRSPQLNEQLEPFEIYVWRNGYFGVPAPPMQYGKKQSQIYDAAIVGSAIAQTTYARCYPNMKHSFYFTLLAARQNSSDAFYLLSQNDKVPSLMRRKFFTEAVRLNHPDALEKLGDSYATGNADLNRPKDLTKALTFYKEAIKHGSRYAENIRTKISRLTI